MKDYKAGLVRHKCSHVMRKGKHVKVYQYTPERKRCPNCGKNISILIRGKTKVR